jgi:adenylyltransferase/sulfurtransferase
MKIIAGIGDVLSGKMLLFDGLDAKFRTIKLRPRKSDIKITELIDYEQFCGTRPHDKDEPLNILDPGHDRISAKELKDRIGTEDDKFLLIDVRTKPEMAICHIPAATNIPLNDLEKSSGEICDKLDRLESKSIIALCRRGNDSQIAVQKLRTILNESSEEKYVIKDVIGGLHAWAKHVDRDFPVY